MLQILSSQPSKQLLFRRSSHHHFRRCRHTVALQLSCHMSPQFAGIACAMTEGLYEKAGINNLHFLPICPVGLEMERVRDCRSTSDNDVIVGCMEQKKFHTVSLQKSRSEIKSYCVYVSYFTIMLSID